MDFKKNTTTHPQTPRHVEESQPLPVRKSGMSTMAKMISGLVILLVVGALVFGCWFMMGTKSKGYTGIKSSQYQAVFLTNGQVYFGKLTDENGTQAKITDIYYLQVQQKVQPAETKDSQVSLAKLGDELHGPEDVMYISKEQVLFWENLKDNSKVVQSIKNSKQ